MNKTGFWNFFGLASWRNLKEVSQEVENTRARFMVDIRESETKIIDAVKQEIVHGNRDMERKVSSSVENAAAEVIRNIDKLCLEIGSLNNSLNIIRGEIFNTKEAVTKSVTDTDMCMEKYYDRLHAIVSECSGVINSADWKIGTALAVFKNDLTDIVDRIDNMDPIVNLDKIEMLLKLLVINDMLDETKKLESISNKK